MRRRPYIALLLIVPALALTACGRGEKVDTAKYTCAEFSKSLRTKNDTTAGQFINKLRDKGSFEGDAKIARRQLTLGIFFACRGKPGSTKPADRAIATARSIRAGKFKIPAQPKAKTGKKSGQ
jgi:hypothetical protein